MLDLVPVVLFLTIGATFVLFFYFRYKTRHDIQETVRAAIATGEALNPEIIESLALSISSPHSDLRRGVISLAIGAAFFLLAVFMGEEDAQGPMMGFAMFPVLVGVAYLGLWFFLGRREADARRAPRTG